MIGLVILAYYSVYLFSLKGHEQGGRATAVLAAVLLLRASVAYIYSNYFTLMLEPEQWLDMYRSNPHGWNLNSADAFLLPRYLHFVLGALAIAGIGLVALGFRKQDITYHQWVIEQGSLLFTEATIVNFGVGFWFLATLPSVVRLNFIGGNGLATGLLGAGLLLPLAAIAHLIMAKGNTMGMGREMELTPE